MGIVISGVIFRATMILTRIRGLITLLITTHEPPSRPVFTGLVPMLETHRRQGIRSLGCA